MWAGGILPRWRNPEPTIFIFSLIKSIIILVHCFDFWPVILFEYIVEFKGRNLTPDECVALKDELNGLCQEIIASKAAVKSLKVTYDEAKEVQSLSVFLLSSYNLFLPLIPTGDLSSFVTRWWLSLLSSFKPLLQFRNSTPLLYRCAVVHCHLTSPQSLIQESYK